MSKEEVAFVKEDNYGPNCSLFVLRSTWIIALVVDTLSVLYLFEVTQGSTPKGWVTDCRGREHRSHLYMEPEQGPSAVAHALYTTQPVKILQRE